METKEYSVTVGGKVMTAMFSDLADQANGSVILKCQDTVVLATACMSESGKNNPGFFNLTVDYLEKFYAAGLILGSQFIRREGRPSDDAVLNSRIIDRTIRPLFDHRIKNAVQIITTVLSVGQSDPGVLAVNAASLALGLSDIPWKGPIGAVQIGKLKGESQIQYDPYVASTGETVYDLDLTVCGREGTINMIEAMAFELPESEMADALKFAEEHIKIIEDFQKSIIADIGKKKMELTFPEVPAAVTAKFAEVMAPKLKSQAFSDNSREAIYAMEREWNDIVSEMLPDEDGAIVSLSKDLIGEHLDVLLHEEGLKNNRRADGRGLLDIRALYAKAGGISPVLHGSGIFYRGQTHVLSVLTLGGPESAYTLDGMEARGKKRFMHHYNFPPYSVGETGRVGGLNRREMGHGMLAEKALIPVIPAKEVFPYTIRVVSESVASNGSTSQASICASMVALMDGGVPVKATVAGISIGSLIDAKDNTNYRLLADIQGPEDHHGDMDFKVAGTRTGITAIQLDVKVDGIPRAILVDALGAAKNARVKIIEAIESEIAKPRADISPNAPKILTTHIRPDQIGLVIGGGGKTIKGIKEKTGAEITIEDDGTVYCVGKDGSAEKALAMVQAMTHEWKVGDSAEGTVAKILEIGAVVKISEFADGLVHISEIAPWRVAKVTDFLKEGMVVPVKVTAVDNERGRISLSIKAANPNMFPKPAQ